MVVGERHACRRRCQPAAAQPLDELRRLADAGHGHHRRARLAGAPPCTADRARRAGATRQRPRRTPSARASAAPRRRWRPPRPGSTRARARRSGSRSRPLGSTCSRASSPAGVTTMSRSRASCTCWKPSSSTCTVAPSVRSAARPGRVPIGARRPPRRRARRGPASAARRPRARTSARIRVPSDTTVTPRDARLPRVAARQNRRPLALRRRATRPARPRSGVLPVPPTLRLPTLTTGPRQPAARAPGALVPRAPGQRQPSIEGVQHGCQMRPAHSLPARNGRTFDGYRDAAAAAARRAPPGSSPSRRGWPRPGRGRPRPAAPGAPGRS